MSKILSLSFMYVKSEKFTFLGVLLKIKHKHPHSFELIFDRHDKISNKLTP